ALTSFPAMTIAIDIITLPNNSLFPIIPAGSRFGYSFENTFTNVFETERYSTEQYLSDIFAMGFCRLTLPIPQETIIASIQ
ncbi:hypothetical protein, partial [Anaplasma phagocytophilum]|uniref:hypothetical protein n=1 Tax=Anaplasma phagocytophilum TaxID=948 RepID=UPI000A68D7B5